MWLFFKDELVSPRSLIKAIHFNTADPSVMTTEAVDLYKVKALEAIKTKQI